MASRDATECLMLLRQSYWDGAKPRPAKPKPAARPRKERPAPVQRQPSPRDIDVARRIETGETLESVAKIYGITRERVRQVALRSGVVSGRYAAARLRREAKQAAREAADKSWAEKIAAGIELVAAGKSFRVAARTVGIGGMTLAGYCDRAGIDSRHGRWRDRTARLQRVAALAAESKSRGEIVRIMRAEGDTISSSWIAQHCLDIDIAADVDLAPTSQPSPAVRTTSPAQLPSEHNVDWTDPAVIAALHRCESEISASKVAKKLSAELGFRISRNAVLGARHRANKKGPRTPA